MEYKHICDESSLRMIAESGNLITYRCSKCGKIQYAIGTPCVPRYSISKRCKVSVRWRKDCSLTEQIISLKKLIPDIQISNAELLCSAKKHELLELMEVYWGEGCELQEKAKESNLVLMITEI